MTTEGRPNATEDSDYNPHEFRNVKNGVSNIETFVHIIKGSLGTGILAMPEAFHNAGYIPGTIGTFLIGTICTYCIHMLIHAQYVICKSMRVPLVSYRDTMRYALLEGPACLHCFSKFSAYLVDFFMVTYQLGICCVYVIFIASNLSQLCQDYTDFSIKIWILIITPAMLLIICIKSLKVLAPFSTVANILILIGLSILLYYLLTDVPDNNNNELFGSIMTMPLFFGTVLFALEAVGVIIALENNMTTPASFGGVFGVFSCGMICIVTLYAFIGFVGYNRYGEDCKGSITLNLPMDTGSKVIRGLYVVAIYISYSLQGFVPIYLLWTNYIAKCVEGTNKENLVEYCLRFGCVLLTVVFALIIPNLGLFISLFGAFCLSVLGITFPALIELCILWNVGFGRFNYILFKDIALIILGLFGLVIGTATSIKDIIHAWNDE